MMSDAKERAALSSIAASVVITAGKGTAGLLTGSLALLSDAAHSLLDVVATTMTWLAIREAAKPADENHHYGHAKVESVAALVETAFLFLLSGAVAIEGIRRLWEKDAELTVHWLAIVVLVVSIAIDGWRFTKLRRVAKETHSEALAADALHFSSDLINSLLVLLAFGAAAMGYPQADALVALGVACFIAVAGYRLAKRTLDTLLDTAPQGSASRISTLVNAVPGVVRVEDIRVRQAGGSVFVDLQIGVARSMPFDRLGVLKGTIIDAIHSAFAEASVTVTATPVVLDEETVLERVLLIAARRRLPIHHVTVQEISGHLSVSLDLEVDGTMSLGNAHLVASQLETAIREELGEETEVETHIEPLVISSLTGRDVVETERNSIEATLKQEAATLPAISDIHNVRARSTEHGLIVNYHCRFDPALEVTHVHDTVDRLEHRVKRANPAIARIVSHTEPAKKNEVYGLQGADPISDGMKEK
jgi:cation diffusion facilitator family transporter